jgi:hypothetical protein
VRGNGRIILDSFISMSQYLGLLNVKGKNARASSPSASLVYAGHLPDSVGSSAEKSCSDERESFAI